MWNQSITRTRWLAFKLGLVGLAAITAAAVGTVAVDWWADPIDKAAAAAENVSRIEPLLFGTRGIVPIGYAAVAFVLGVTAGMLVRRTSPRWRSPWPLGRVWALQWYETGIYAALAGARSLDSCV